MTERERLIKLLDERIAIQECSFSPDKPLTTDSLAGYLLDHGIIVPPCKVGDTVWMVRNLQIERWKVVSIEKTASNMTLGIKFIARGVRSTPISISTSYIGEIYFLTREEAEAVLAERRKI